MQFSARSGSGIRRSVRALGAVFFAAGTGLGMAAGASGRGAPATLELVSEVRAIAPGVPFTVALRIVHAPGHHTYWSHPGIVGVPTSLEWKLPEGFAAGAIQWPQPEVVKMGVVNAYGYGKETFLLVDITPPPALPGDRVDLRARAVYMACGTTCHPGFQDLELALPVAEGAAAAAAAGEGEGEGPARETEWDPRWREGFQTARASFPVELAGWKCAVRRSGERIQLRMDPVPGEAKPNLGVRRAYFFSTDNQVDSDAPQEVRRTEAGGMILELAPAFYGPKDPKTFRGILYSADGWLEGAPVKAMKIEVSWRESARGDP